MGPIQRQERVNKAKTQQLNYENDGLSLDNKLFGGCVFSALLLGSYILSYLATVLPHMSLGIMACIYTTSSLTAVSLAIKLCVFSANGEERVQQLAEGEGDSTAMLFKS